MKKAFKLPINYLLKKTAAFILKKRQPEIVGITGSVGKTSTKEAVVHLLSKKKRVYAPLGNYNTEIGVPLAVIGAKTPSNVLNVFAWTAVIAKGFFRAFDDSYPEILVLEMGVDRPGDMDYFTDFIKPNVAVVTAIAPVHMANFISLDELAAEKLKITQAAKELIVINRDQVNFRGSGVPVMTYGHDGKVSFKAFKDSPEGSEFMVGLGHDVAQFKTRLIGEHSVYAVLAAVACGGHYDFSLTEMAGIFKNYASYPGRMNPLEGFNGAFIIDDTYNASPEGVKAALKAASKFSGRKILALGQMNELGQMSPEAHREIGALAGGMADILVTVGEDANNYLAESAVANGLAKDKVYKYLSSREAGKALRKELKKGDVVLAKGSQNKVFMEELVKEILKDKKDTKGLVRQSLFWKKNKDNYFNSIGGS